MTAAFLALTPLLDSSGCPSLLAFLLAVALVDLPVLLGVMRVAGKKRNGRYSLEGVVLCRDKVPWGTFAPVFVGAFVAVYIWDVQSQVIYWCRATEIDGEHAYIIVYDGKVWPRAKSFGPAYLGFRCVRKP